MTDEERKEANRLRQKRWREKNREKSRYFVRRWQQKNVAKDYETKKKWRAKNPDKVKKADTTWRSKNPEKVNLRSFRRRALKKGAHGKCSLEQIRARVEFYGGLCWIPGCKKPYEALDHVISLYRGGTNWPSNLRPICKSHNSKKGAKGYREFLEEKDK